MPQLFLGICTITLPLCVMCGQISVSALWSTLDEYVPSPYDNGTEYTFRYKTYDVVKGIRVIYTYNESQTKCRQSNGRLPRLEDLAGELFQRRIFADKNFISVNVNRELPVQDESGQYVPTNQWVTEKGRFFLHSPETQVKRLVELENDRMLIMLLDTKTAVVTDNRDKVPTLILCVQERQLPKTTPPPKPTQMMETPLLRDCACNGRVASSGDGQPLNIGGQTDFPWPLACVAFLGVMCLCLATALLIVCRRSHRRAADGTGSPTVVGHMTSAGAGVKNGHSIPRTSSSLMEFNGHGGQQPEKAHSLAATTMPRRPRIIHHGQVHTNGYLTLGSIQARKQREMQREIGLSQPPSPNHSLARSDYQPTGTMSVR